MSFFNANLSQASTIKSELKKVGMTMLCSARNYRSMFWSALLAPAVVFPTFSHATEVRLFPVSKSSAATNAYGEPMVSVSEAPANNQPSQPLRVVIPNISKEKAEQNREAARRAVSAGSESPKQNARPSAIQQFSRNIYQNAQTVWKNGVMVADWTNVAVIKSFFKPNIAFAALPESWRYTRESSEVTVGQDGNVDEIASLAPAAGGTIQPLIEQHVDTTEPAPALSTQSKVIARKMAPPVDNPPEAPLAKKVDIARAREMGDVLNKAADAKPNEALGLTMDAARAAPNENYELERAYNALIAGKSDLAIQIYEDVLTGNPRNKEALFGLASTYHRAGQIDMARALYGKLLQIDPKHRDGLNNFLVLLADEAPREALVQMERLESQNPGFSPIPAQMAVIYQKLGDQEKAVDKMYHALSIAPENITYRYNLAVMLDRNGKYEEAGKLYSQILDAHAKGEVVPGDKTKIQQRLTFIRSNTL